MVPSTIFSATIYGFECRTVEVEADILNGPASITIVGLGDTSVQESKERIRSAIKNSSADYPRKKKTINLAPANIPKHGPLYDLPIALGLMVQSKQIPAIALEACMVVGELALSGEVRRIAGVLPITHFAARNGFKRIIVPAANAREAGLVPGIEVTPAKTLEEVVRHLRGEFLIPPIDSDRAASGRPEEFPWRFEDIAGHEYVKRALTIAAAGGHHLIMYGPPGSGKTILARSMQSILPALPLEEALEVTSLYSIGCTLDSGSPLIQKAPFRMVHNTASTVSIVGGGSVPKPGEISLAHCGVLFLDEMLEFPRASLEVLRQPIEEGIVHIARAKGSVTFPARCILIAATNPCPCGYLDDPIKACKCTPSQLALYRKKLSGPLLDRIDLECYVPRVSYEKLRRADDLQNADDLQFASEIVETSERARQRVKRARHTQRERFQVNGAGANCSGMTNAAMSAKMVRAFCSLDKEAQRLLSEAFREWHYSSRAYYKILKIARTIADLDEREKIEAGHLAEALQYRPRFAERDG